jgi:integrase/recombinase XerD
MTPIVPFTLLVQRFFEQHLSVERNASPHTVLAYRDALKLFLGFVGAQRRCSPDQLDHSVLEVETVTAFLRWLETDRNCGPRTRNLRLAALKTFARYVASVAPEYLDRCRRIRELPPARFGLPPIKYLDNAEVLQLTRATNPSASHRERALFLLLYNTGARVHEIVALNVGDLRRAAVPFVAITGKGRKQRTCPLWARTVAAIDAWLAERGGASGDAPLFVNARGGRLSRSGIAYILRRLAECAALEPHHAPRLSPHVIRHTTAMHLLQAGVDITTVAAWLGHAHLNTTHGYVEIDLRAKNSALAAAALPELPQGRYPTGGLLSWLASLGRGPRYAQSPPRPANGSQAPP